MDPATICPLCGGPNRCGVAQGKGTCWCFYTDMPESVLAQIPEAERLRACICEACAQQSPAPAGRTGAEADAGAAVDAGAIDAPHGGVEPH